MMAAPKPYRPMHSSVPAPAGQAGTRGIIRGTIQGRFSVRPYITPAARHGVAQPRTITQNLTQSRPGMEAFQVELRPSPGGWPLPRDIQAKMEGALGSNFADVRVHVGSEAAAIGALAFTWGSDLYFAPGQYNPHTTHGQFLLGHELQHVVQQRSGRVANPFGSGVAVVQDRALEAEADRMGHLAASYRVA